MSSDAFPARLKRGRVERVVGLIVSFLTYNSRVSYFFLFERQASEIRVGASNAFILALNVRRTRIMMDRCP